ncbi:hypothetical protein McanMca71_005244, partial [Microsporum canis]
PEQPSSPMGQCASLEKLPHSESYNFLAPMSTGGRPSPLNCLPLTADFKNANGPQTLSRSQFQVEQRFTISQTIDKTNHSDLYRPVGVDIAQKTYHQTSLSGAGLPSTTRQAWSIFPPAPEEWQKSTSDAEPPDGCFMDFESTQEKRRWLDRLFFWRSLL